MQLELIPRTSQKKGKGQAESGSQVSHKRSLTGNVGNVESGWSIQQTRSYAITPTNAESIPKTPPPTTGVQNPSELASVVSYCEYSRELVRWQSWERGVFFLQETLLHL